MLPPPPPPPVSTIPAPLGVFVLDDAATVESLAFAATAQVAEQQGDYLAAALNASAAAALPTSAHASIDARASAILSRAIAAPFEYRHRGSLAVLGTFSGVSDFSPLEFVD